MRLGYGLENLNFYWLLPKMDVATGLRIVDSDAETLIMKQIAYKVSNLVLYFDGYNSFDDRAWEDIVINPISTLPKVLSPRKPAPERHDDDSSNISDNDGSTDGDFVDSDYEVDAEDDDLFWDNVDEGVVDQGAALGIVVSKWYKSNAPYGKENMQTDRQWDEQAGCEPKQEGSEQGSEQAGCEPKQKGSAQGSEQVQKTLIWRVAQLLDCVDTLLYMKESWLLWSKDILLWFSSCSSNKWN